MTMIRIAIVGMGLIGTSLGMALRAGTNISDALGQVQVIGYDADKANTKEARGRLAIDVVADSLKQALEGTHLVVLAVPAQTMPALFREIAPLLAAGAVVTDVCSTKAQIAAWADEILPNVNPFVGGHPMAGRDASGPKAATPELFKGSVYCLCPGLTTPPQAIALCEAVVDRIGAKTYFIEPVEHDAYVAGISHMPFVLAAGLVNMTSSASSWREMSALAATGFRDTTRLASGDVIMHRDIVMTNRIALDRWLTDTITQLQSFQEAVVKGDEAAITDFFSHAKTARATWLEQKPGMRPGEADYEDTGMDLVQKPSLFGRMGGKKS
jgi:prephenate dehydrogenase